MDDPTIEFGLITFQDLRTAAYSPSRIGRALLRDRVLFARTNQGNYAKLQVHSGDDLHVARLTVYSPDGCILRSASDLVIRSSYSCDLDNACESSTGADFWWHGISPGVHYLEPQNSAGFHLCRDFEELGFAEVQGAEYVARRVERAALVDQVVFCRTNQGRYAKLLLQAGNTLRVRRLVVYEATGQVRLDRANIDVPQTWTLDVDTGAVGAAGYDLWWEAETATSFFLTPRNGGALSFPSYFRLERYAPLLRSPAIRAALSWRDAAGTRAYDAWSENERAQLREFLYLREMGRELPISGPPALASDTYMKPCDAWKIYLAHVAQSLWIEANGRVAWRLQSSSEEHLAHLFDATRLMAFRVGAGHAFALDVMGMVTHWSPQISFSFLESAGLVEADPWSTVQAVADWCRANLVHIAGYQYDTEGGPFASQADQWQYIYGYRGLPLVDKMIYPLPGRRHTTHGCWGTDGFLAAVLRTVNVPVRHGRSNFSDALHSRPEFFSVGRALSHGDDPYNGWVRLGHHDVPIDRVFYDLPALAAEIDAPAPLPGRTVSQTASYNHTKRLVGLAVEFETDYLLRLRCQDVSSGATGHAARLWAELHEYYSDAEIAAIAARCDAAIAAIPGGCAAIP